MRVEPVPQPASAASAASTSLQQQPLQQQALRQRWTLCNGRVSLHRQLKHQSLRPSIAAGGVGRHEAGISSSRPPFRWRRASSLPGSPAASEPEQQDVSDKGQGDGAAGSDGGLAPGQQLHLTNGQGSSGLAQNGQGAAAAAAATTVEVGQPLKGMPHRWRVISMMALSFVLCNMDKVSTLSSEIWGRPP